MNLAPMTLLVPNTLRMTLDLRSEISDLCRQRINLRRLQTIHTLAGPGMFVVIF